MFLLRWQNTDSLYWVWKCVLDYLYNKNIDAKHQRMYNIWLKQYRVHFLSHDQNQHQNTETSQFNSKRAETSWTFEIRQLFHQLMKSSKRICMHEKRYVTSFSASSCTEHLPLKYCYFRKMEALLHLSQLSLTWDYTRCLAYLPTDGYYSVQNISTIMQLWLPTRYKICSTLEDEYYFILECPAYGMLKR